MNKILLTAVLVSTGAVWAEDPPASQAANPPPTSESSPDTSASPAAVSAEDFGGDEAEPVTKKRNVVRRKDAGSRAKERFQADIIPKSHYTLDGKTLSVDPD